MPKQIRTILLLLLALALACASAGAETAGTRYVDVVARADFREAVFASPQSLAVYPAPDRNALTGEAGPEVFTGDRLGALGREGDWLVVLYGPEDRPRLGYVYIGSVIGEAPRLSQLYYSIEKPLAVTAATPLVDFPGPGAAQLSVIAPGAAVTQKFMFRDGGRLYAYVETTVSGRPVRGFIDLPGQGQSADPQPETQAASGRKGASDPPRAGRQPRDTGAYAADGDITRDEYIDLVNEIGDVTLDLLARLDTLGMTDRYSPEALAAARAFLLADVRVKDAQPAGSGIVFEMKSGLLGAFATDNYTPGIAGTTVLDAESAFKRFNGGGKLEDVIVPSSATLTNRNSKLLVFDTSDNTMNDVLGYDARILSQYAEALGGGSFQAYTGVQALDAIYDGSYTDCGLLVIAGHGLKWLKMTYVAACVFDSADDLPDYIAKPDIFLKTGGTGFLGNWFGQNVMYELKDDGPAFRISFNYDFLEEHIGEHVFDNTVFVPFICHTGYDRKLTGFFTDHGAAAVVACDDALINWQHILSLFALTFDAEDVSSLPSVMDIRQRLVALNDPGLRAAITARAEQALSSYIAGSVFHDGQGRQVTFGDKLEAYWYRQHMTTAINGRNMEVGPVMLILPRAEMYLAGKGELKGRVFAYEDEPLEDAEVTLYAWQDHGFTPYGEPVLTDKNGDYRFEEVPYGIWGIRAVYNQHRGTAVCEHRLPETEATPVDMDLRYRGRVVDEDGKPCPGRDVVVNRQSDEHPAFYLLTTDEDGWYTFTGIRATYIASVTDGEDTVTAEAVLSPGEKMNMPDIVLGLNRVSGRVLTQVNLRDGPAPYAYVQAYFLEDGEYRKAGDLVTADADGVYQLRCRSGRYRFEAHYGGMKDVKEMTVDAAHTSVPDMLAGVTVAGTITSAKTGKPVKAVIVTITHEDGTQDGTVSDENGYWRCNAQNGESLQCDFMGVGYAGKSITIPSSFTKGGSYLHADVALPPEEALPMYVEYLRKQSRESLAPLGQFEIDGSSGRDKSIRELLAMFTERPHNVTGLLSAAFIDMNLDGSPEMVTISVAHSKKSWQAVGPEDNMYFILRLYGVTDSGVTLQSEQELYGMNARDDGEDQLVYFTVQRDKEGAVTIGMLYDYTSQWAGGHGAGGILYSMEDHQLVNLRNEFSIGYSRSPLRSGHAKIPESQFITDMRAAGNVLCRVTFQDYLQATYSNEDCTGIREVLNGKAAPSVIEPGPLAEPRNRLE